MQPGSAAETFLLPAQNSTVASSVDDLYMFIYYLSIVFFVIVIGGMFYFVAQYRRRPGGPKVKQISHNTALEIAWSVIPTILVIFIFLWGVRGFLDMSLAPKGATEIYVHASKWQWEFEDLDGNKSLSELVVPVNKPIKLIMSSNDVLHSFFVPNFRVKSDVVPGRYTTIWFEANKPGINQVFCTEYCGTGHSAMLATVKVLSEEDYMKWKKESDEGPTWGDEELAEKGAGLYKTKTCVACHSLDGSRLVGPSFKGLYGRTEEIEGGPSVEVDENYIRESINEPMAKIVKGYPGAMPTFKGLLKPREMDALVAYLKTVK